MSDFDKNNQNTPQNSNGPNPNSGPNDSMDLVRKRRDRMKNHRPSTSPKLSPQKKLFGFILLCAFAIGGYWTFKSDDFTLEDNDLPVLMAEDSSSEDSPSDYLSDFKTAPNEEDIIASPNSDKQFYAELDQSERKSLERKKTGLRALPERPTEQISQEAMQNEAIELAEKESEEVQQDAIVAEAQNPQENPNKVEPSKTVSRPKKTLEMAMMETKRKMLAESKLLASNDDLSKKELKNPTDQLKIIENADDTSGSSTTTGTPQKTKTQNAKITLETTSKSSKSGSKLLAKAETTKPKPAVIQTKSSAKTQAVPTKSQNKTVTIHKGAYWVQVASMSTQDTAVKESKRIESRSKNLLSAKNRRTLRVDLGKPKGIKHRVQYGPFSKPSAVDTCKTLKGEYGISCFVTRG